MYNSVLYNDVAQMSKKNGAARQTMTNCNNSVSYGSTKISPKLANGKIFFSKKRSVVQPTYEEKESNVTYDTGPGMNRTTWFLAFELTLIRRLP